MGLSVEFSVCLLLASGLCFAKKNALPMAPFHSGHVLEELSSVQMKTAEISAFMPNHNLLFVVGGEGEMEVVDFKNPAFPKVISENTLPGNASSVTVHGNVVAVSLLQKEAWKEGQVQVMRYGNSLETLGTFKVCSQPDMITFSPDGLNLLVACEGSPSDDFSEDPEGAVALLSIPGDGGDSAWRNPDISIVNFRGLDSTALKAAGVRAPGVRGFVRSLEPEYITVSEDSKVAWVSLQENNALLKLDVPGKKIQGVFPLGYVDHSKKGFGLDVVSNGRIEIKNYPLRGLRQPDGIAAFSVKGKTYVLTANEGAPVNDYKAWTDVTTPMMLARQNVLDGNVFNDKLLEELKNLSVSNLERCDQGLDKTANGKCPYLYSFGSRSVSLFDGTTGKLLWDSGDVLEQTLAKIAPDYFNWNAKKNKVKMDSRSEDKGLEPENVAVGMVGKKRYVFVGMERSSGIAVFDMTNLDFPRLEDFYMNPKDRGPEGLLFISADKSPIAGQALLVVGYEYSKTLTVYAVSP